MKRKVIFFASFTLLVINIHLWLYPSKIFAGINEHCKDYITSFDVVPLLNGKAATWADKQFDQIQYTIHFSENESEKEYLIYSDNNVAEVNGDISEKFTVTNDDISKGHTKTENWYFKLNSIRAPFTTWPTNPHTITVSRTPGTASEYHCATFSYTILPAPTPTPSYTCTIDTSTTGANPIQNGGLSVTDSFNVQVNFNRQVNNALLLLDNKEAKRYSNVLGFNIFNFTVKPLSDSGTHILEADVMTVKDQTGNLIKLASCIRNIYVCSAKEIINTPGKCVPEALTPTPGICPNSCFPPNCARECSYCAWNCPNYASPVPSHGPVANIETLCKSSTQGTGHPELLETCLTCAKTGGVWSAIGCLPTDLGIFINKYLFTAGIGLIGGVAFLYLLYGAFLIMTSAGNPEQVAQAREIITSSLMGLLLAIFSILILRIISVDILRLPDFGPVAPTSIPPVPTAIPHGILP